MPKAHQLTEGSLETIMNGGHVENATVQIIGSKEMVSHLKDGPQQRYRLLVSDGKFKVNVAIFNAANSQEAAILQPFTVVKLKRYLTNVIKNKDNMDTRVLLIVHMELVALGNEVGCTVGNPRSLTDEFMSQTQAEAPAVCHKMALRNADDSISPIASLNPFHNNWTVLARVANKSNVRSWANSRGEGKLFNVGLFDQSGEIKCTGFREHVDQFYDAFEVDKAYYISGCLLKPINVQYCSMKHNFEMTLTSFTKIKECLVDEGLPRIEYNFTTFDKIAVMVAGTLVDIIGICKDISELEVFTSKSTNRELTKREIFLVDQSTKGINLVLWGSAAKSFPLTKHPIILIKNAKIHEFLGTKSLGATVGSHIKINPDIPETHKLKNWYEFEGFQCDYQNISASNLHSSYPWMHFKDIAQHDFSQEPILNFQTFATILLIRLDRAVYKACPSGECQKKVVDLANGMYRCDKCNKEFPDFKYRLLVSMNVSDATGSHWVTMFCTEAEQVLGRTSREIGEGLERDSEGVAKMFEEAQFKQFVFKCRARLEMFNDQRKIRVVVVGLKDINFEEFNGYLIKRIQQISGVALH